MKASTAADKLSICLIGGSGRSGTTVLKRIFCKHPEVAYVPEWRFTIDPDGLIDFYNTFSEGWSPYLYDVKLRRLEKLLRDVGKSSFAAKLYAYGFKKLKLEPKTSYKLSPRYMGINAGRYCPKYVDLVEQLIEQLREFRYQGVWTGSELFQKSTFIYHKPWQPNELACVLGHFFRQVVLCALENQGARHYVEDNTWNILWFDKLLQLVPEARLVHIYRDPRDVVASYIKQSWAPSDPVQAASFYKDIMERWFAVHRLVPPDSFKEISLEDLVANPKAVLKSICDFWAIEWHEALLTTDLSHSNSGRWKKDFTIQQQKQISAILEKVLFELGYE